MPGLFFVRKGYLPFLAFCLSVDGLLVLLDGASAFFACLLTFAIAFPSFPYSFGIVPESATLEQVLQLKTILPVACLPDPGRTARNRFG